MLNPGRTSRERRCWLLDLDAGANIVCQHKNVRYTYLHMLCSKSKVGSFTIKDHKNYISKDKVFSENILFAVIIA
jgi:hypothetical protein